MQTPELRKAYRLMFKARGHQDWWPSDSPFEVCIGAILTQNTAWTNVEKAIQNLKEAGILSLEGIEAVDHDRLASLIRPAGYFNLKAKRLKAFVKPLVEDYDGDLNKFFKGPLESVRNRVLEINGVGPETADCMLLYAGSHRSFVVDTYTKRIFERHGWCSTADTYDSLKTICESALSQKSGGDQLDYWQDYHAQLVMVGKDHCRPKDPKCESCPLQSLLREKKH